MNTLLSNQTGDPREREDFDPALLPLCDGELAPLPNPSDKMVQRMIEFAAVYYEMNCVVQLLEKARASGDSPSEQEALKKLRAASRKRDGLEDRCLPQAFYAEPVMDGEYYVNLRFTWPGKPEAPVTYNFQYSTEITDLL